MLLPEEIKVSVKLGESINDFKINAIQTFKISGRVVGAVDKEPVANADVLIRSELPDRHAVQANNTCQN